MSSPFSTWYKDNKKSVHKQESQSVTNVEKWHMEVFHQNLKIVNELKQGNSVHLGQDKNDINWLACRKII